MIQRLASWSYTTLGSPLLSVSHRPPKPVKRVLVATGPYCRLPVLLNTANERFTVCTKLFGPTAPFVSGGAPETKKPGSPWPMPSKDEEAAGAAAPEVLDCTAVSGAPVAICGMLP
jgi:hypothetical protein